MATQPGLAVHVPTLIRKKRPSGQQKREDLEREVAVLHKMLDHEQKVNEILELVHQREDGSTFCIPNFLPPKAKELLAELVMVEDEIARLESLISQLHSNLDREKEITKETKSKQETLTSFPEASSIPQRSIPSSKGLIEKKAFETKALHFISKAIKGDYNLSEFSRNEKLARNSKGLSDHKENQFHEGFGIGLQERVPKKIGMLKPASPLRELRHPTPSPRRERNLDSHIDLPPKAISSPMQSEEESIHKWSPNKLSENILKCLNFIFVRLLRTSRAMELEKSGPISRSTNFSLSFRADTSLNPKANPLSQKESRQQDPYGIFEMEESIPRDIGPYKNLVVFASSSLDPNCISNSSSLPLLQKLRVLMNSLQKLDLRFLTYQQKLAFWINIYNACIMDFSNMECLLAPKNC